MMRSLCRYTGLFLLTLCVCAGLLVLVCAVIPQSSLQPSAEQAVDYFAARDGAPRLFENNVASLVHNYADAALLDVVYNVDSSRPVHSVIAAPYYRTEGDLRDDLRASVIDHLPPNSEYARYWHGMQVFVRPLLTVTGIEGCRMALFALLLALNGWLCVVLIRKKAFRPLLIYLFGLLVVQFWMCAFTIEYISIFLVMSGACIAVALSGRKPEHMTAICLISGALACFLDFLTAETLTLTVPVLMWLMLGRERGETVSFKALFGKLARWCAAWLCAYAAMYVVKWGLVYAVLGRQALMNVFTSAVYRVDRALDAAQGLQTSTSALLPMVLARNLGCLVPFFPAMTTRSVLWVSWGVLVVWGSVFYLLRANKPDSALLLSLLAMGLVPFARLLALSSHSLDHYFFTYRALMATVMALLAVLVYGLKPSDVLVKKKHRR